MANNLSERFIMQEMEITNTKIIDAICFSLMIVHKNILTHMSGGGMKIFKHIAQIMPLKLCNRAI